MSIESWTDPVFLAVVVVILLAWLAGNALEREHQRHVRRRAEERDRQLLSD